MVWGEEPLRRVLVESGTTLLGLVHHLTLAERLSVEGVPAGYRAAIAASDAAIQSVGDLAEPVALPVDGTFHSVRWVVAQLTGQPARHAGPPGVLRDKLNG